MPVALTLTSVPRVRRRRLVALAASGLMAIVALAGCGADEPTKTDLRDALTTSGLSRSVADCVADAVIDTLSPDEVARLVERGSGGAPQDDPKRTDDSADKLRTAMGECRTLQAETASTTTTTTTAAADPGPTTSAPAGEVAPGSDGAQFNTTVP